MQNLRTVLLGGLGFNMIWLSASGAWAQVAPPPQFSADILLTRPARAPVKGRVYSTGDKWRFDVASAGREGAMIFDLRARTTYVLMPQMKLYTEVHGTGAATGPLSLPDMLPVDPSNPCALAPGADCRKLGSEVVNGRTCDDWQLSRGGITRVGCLDRRLHVYIRTTSSDGSVAELRNISQKVQPQDLFEIPVGYRKMEPSQAQLPK